MQKILTSFAIATMMASAGACGVEGDELDTDTAAEEIGIAAASSSSIVNTGGTRAGEAFFNQGGPPYIDLYDAKCDNHQVYVLYQQNGGFTSRFNNGGGCGTTARVYLPDHKGQVVYWAYVDIQAGSDVPGARAIDFDW